MNLMKLYGIVANAIDRDNETAFAALNQMQKMITSAKSETKIVQFDLDKHKKLKKTLHNRINKLLAENKSLKEMQSQMRPIKPPPGPTPAPGSPLPAKMMTSHFY